jgi:hypothetical protein
MFERIIIAFVNGSYPVAVSPLLTASLFTLLETILSEIAH